MSQIVGSSLGLNDTTGAVVADGVDINDGKDITIGSTTGTKIGQSTSKIGHFGVTPVVQPAAYTQTYSTAARTNPNATAATLTDNSGGSADTTIAVIGATYSQTTIANNFADVVAMINKLTADHLASKKLLNALIDDAQALGNAQ